MEGVRLGPYLIRRELGSGGMATVYLATVEEGVPGLAPGRPVALKIVHPHLLSTPGFLDRFLREVEVGKRIRHENVVRTYDAGTAGGNGDETRYMVMEYVEGQTLRGLLAELGWVPEDLCRHIGREVTRALTAIHAENIIHRDLKPENVLITSEDVVKVMDLGVARLQDEAFQLSQTGQFVGSVMYAAPEQFRGLKGGLDGRIDLYSLGVTLYELASGVNPFRDDNFASVVRRQLTEEARDLSDLNPQVSPFFEELVARLMRKSREERFESATVLLQVLTEGEESGWWRDRSAEIRAATLKPLRRIRIPRETALHGREEELARLTELWESVKAGEGRVLLVEGEAGIGKTRLVDEFAARLEREGEDFHYLFGAFPPGGAATASGAFCTAYREHFGTEGLEERLAEYLSVTPALVPAFAALLRGEPPPEGAEPLTRESIQTVFVHVTRALAEERPVLVLLDDLHLAPGEGRALFAALALAAPGHRVFLVGTARPELPVSWQAEIEAREHATRMVVERLGDEAVRGVLAEAFRSPRLVEQLAPLVLTKTDGNPFFLFEVIRGLREGRFLAETEDGSWVATQAIRRLEIPSSVRELVMARIAALGEEERDLLDVAACCGFEFDPGLVGEALGLPRIAALRKFGHLEKDHRLVRASGRKYVFDHHQARDVLYENLGELLREEYHAALGETLQAVTGAAEMEPGEIDGGLAVDLAGHFLLGARGERALRYLDAALDHLGNGYQNARLVELADRALAAPGLLTGARRVEVLLRKAGPLELAGLRGEQREVLEEAVRLAAEIGDPALEARARGRLGVHHWLISRNDKAREILRETVELARRAGDRGEEASAIGSLGNVYLRLGRHEEARERYETQLEIAREIGDRREEGRAVGNLGILAFRRGRIEEARGHYETYLAISKELSDKRGEANAAGNLGIMYHSLGKPAEARPWVERQLALAREMGDRRAEGMASSTLGLVLKDLGRLPEAREMHERHREIAREIGDLRGEGIATGNLGLVLKKMGRFEEARECHEKHLSMAVRIGDRRGEGLARLSRAVTLEALGRLGEALDDYEHQLAFARETGDVGGELIGGVNLGLLLLRLGDVETGRERLIEAKGLAEKLGAREAVGATLAGLGFAAEIEGREGRARELYLEARETHRRAEAKSGEVEARVALGRLAILSGDPEAARDSLREAVEIAEDLDEPGPAVLARAWRAVVDPAEAAAAEEALELDALLLDTAVRMEAHHALFRATGDPDHAEEAARILDYLADQVPEDRRSAFRETPLPRRIRG